MGIIARLPLLLLLWSVLCNHVERDEVSADFSFFVFFKIPTPEKEEVFRKASGVLITGSTALTCCETAVDDNGTLRMIGRITAVVNLFERKWWKGIDLQVAHNVKLHPGCQLAPKRPPANNTAVFLFSRDFFMQPRLPKFASVYLWKLIIGEFQKQECGIAYDGAKLEATYEHNSVHTVPIKVRTIERCAQMYLNPTYDSKKWFETSGMGCGESVSLTEETLGRSNAQMGPLYEVTRLGAVFYCVVGSSNYIIGIHSDYHVMNQGGELPEPIFLYASPQSFSDFVSSTSHSTCSPWSTPLPWLIVFINITNIHKHFLSAIHIKI